MSRVRILLIATIAALALSATTEAAKPYISKKRTTTTSKKRSTAKSTNNPQKTNNYYGGNSYDIIDAKTVTEEIPLEAPTPPPPPKPADKNKVYDSAEQEPVFPGGQAALLKYVAEHLKYPEAAQENGIQGKVTVQFVIKSDGSIGQVRVVRGKDPVLDREAVRVVKTLPKFTPGKMNGHAVNVWYTLPITFRLSD